MRIKLIFYEIYKVNYQLSIFLIIISVLTLPEMILSQEYPYEINQYQEFERNPTFTLNDLTTNTFDYTHKGFLPGMNKYNSDKISYKHYFEGLFSGAGIFFSRNQTGDSASYTYAGISAAYRNIVFDKAYIKFGLTYKFIYNHSSAGIYDDLSFYSKNTFTTKNYFTNFNASFAVSSPSDFYFISAGVCNVNPFENNSSENSPFLVQYNFSAGNFFSLIGSQKSNYLSVTYIQNATTDRKFYSRGYFATLYTTVVLTRRSSLKVGLSGGYVENTNYNITPFIFLLKKKYVIKLSTLLLFRDKIFDLNNRYYPQLAIILKL